MIQGALFDMDGLMFDTETIWEQVWGPVFAKYGYTAPDDFNSQTLGRGGAQTVEIIAETCGEGSPAQRIYDDTVQAVDAELRRYVPKMKGIDALLEHMSASGYALGVVSGSPRDLIEHCLEDSGVARHFSYVLSTTDIEHGKPAPDGYLMGAEALGIDPDKTLVIEDSPTGIRAGYAGGFITVMVPDRVQPTEEVLTMCDACCKDLDELRELLESGAIGQ